MSELKPLLNEVDVVGRVKEVNLETGTTRDGKENIKGTVTILVKESVEGEVRSHDIRVRVYSNKFKKDGTLNGLYSGYETVMNEYKSIAETGNEQDADLVHVQGSLRLNEFIGQDGQRHSNVNVEAKFFNRIDKDKAKKLKGPKAIAKVESVITGIKDKLDEEGLPSGDKTLSAFNVDFFGKLREGAKPVVPFDAVISEDLADSFESLYDVNDTGKLTLKINNYAEEASEEDVQEVSGFGDTSELAQVKRNFVNNLEVVGGTMPYQEPKAYDEEQIKEAKRLRQKAIESVEEGYVPQEKKSETENVFGKVDISDDSSDIEDLDF